MKKINPLDQVVPIAADAHNHTVKVVNKFGSRDSILYKLKKFSSSVPDFRRLDKGNLRHSLDDIIMLMILARASKCVGRAERGTVLDNGRNPDIVSAYSYNTGITLTTEACREKSNEIKAIPQLIDKINISGKIVTADAMSMQKCIIDRIRENGGDFLIELKANQPSLRYGVEDRLKGHTPVYSYTEGPELGHGRIETRTYRIFNGLDIIADKEKWGGNMTIIEYESDTIKKSSGTQTAEKRLYVSSLPTDTPALGSLVRNHWSIESMHWTLDCNLLQDRIKRKSARAARNLDTIQRIVHSLFSIWKGLRKKREDKKKGMAELMRKVSMDFTKLLRFLRQK